MRIFFLAVLLSATVHVFAQDAVSGKEPRLPKHYISVNPLNMLLFQQIGVSYEFKPGRMGYGLTAGYIYPNKQEYSNYFLAGPTNYGSLGWYSGYFIVPQVNIYFNKPKNPKHTGLLYLAVKGVYKYMSVDSTQKLLWTSKTDDYYWKYRKQYDRVNLFGAFADFGFRYVLYHFFFEINCGPGVIYLHHHMLVAGESTGPLPVRTINPPREETLNQFYGTVNFTINIGVAF